jgi:hypothetical protein
LVESFCYLVDFFFEASSPVGGAGGVSAEGFTVSKVTKYNNNIGLKNTASTQRNIEVLVLIRYVGVREEENLLQRGIVRPRKYPPTAPATRPVATLIRTTVTHGVSSETVAASCLF